MPTDLKPYLYELTLKPFVGPFYGSKSFKFDGFLNLSFTCVSPTKKIVLHSKDLKINGHKLHQIKSVSDFYQLNRANEENDEITLDKTIQYDNERDFLIFDSNRPCQANVNYLLELNFTGTILETLYGFYRSSYKDSNGSTH